MTDLTGTTLGRYQVLARLGRGGMAEVYKGYQPNLDRYVAIKVLHPSMVEEADFVERFQREARNVARLRHPNIVQVVDSDVQGDFYFMVMEYLDGPTLRAALEEVHRRGEEMPLGVALRIVSDVAAALNYAHEMGVVHRDVKPANIMLDRTGRVILTDFGVAKMLSGTKLTATGTVLGTPAYMSPEQGAGQPGDARSDIYSLGVVLYELATGRLPYDADTPLAILLKHAHDPLPLPRTVNPSLPEKVERILLRALAKAPAIRYQTVQAMLDDIASLPPKTIPQSQPGALDTRTLAARAPMGPPAPPPRTPPPARVPEQSTGARPRGRFLLGGGVVLAIVGCLGLVGLVGLALVLTGTVPLGGLAAVLPTPATATSVPSSVPPTRTPPPTPAPVEAPAMLFSDSFSDPNSGWDRVQTDEGITDYDNGGYRIFVNKPRSDYWANPGRMFGDVRVEVEATKAGGPDDNDFGVICRYQDTENFYYFVISSDGFFGILRILSGETQTLGADGLKKSDAILLGRARNHLRADCIGDQLTLYVNGQQVHTARDPSFPTGDVGLLAGTYDMPGTDIHFDNFVVHAP